MQLNYHEPEHKIGRTREMLDDDESLLAAVRAAILDPDVRHINIRRLTHKKGRPNKRNVYTLETMKD